MKKVLFYSMMAVAVVSMAVACGKKDEGGGASGNTTAATPTSCPSGQLYDSRYGCLNQGSCGNNSALYNNQCIVVQVTNVNNTAQNCSAGSTWSSYRNACLSQANCGYGYVLYNNVCEYAGNNNVNYQNNYYNGYQFQNGYFYPQYPNYYNYYGNGYNNGYYPYYNGYNGGFRGGIWFRYY